MPFQRKPDRPDTTMHELVAEVAIGMARELYDQLKSDNSFYSHNHTKEDERYFLERIAPECRKGARTILAEMLLRNDVSEIEKERISEALILDNMLPKTGTSVVKKKDYGIRMN
jgi:hypothetical protein